MSKLYIKWKSYPMRGQELFLALACLFLLALGCNPRPKDIPRRDIEPLKPGRIVVLGFYAAVRPGGQPRMIRDPLSGAVFISEPVPYSVVTLMNGMLMSRLAEREKYEFVRPGEARGVIAGLAEDDKVLADNALTVMREVGKKLNAESVIVGHIYRWRERRGSNYAVESPASVAFDLHLVQGESGEVLWSGAFDKEQWALSESVFDYRTFFHSKGKWMTAQELASLGLIEMMKNIPLERSMEPESNGVSNSSH